MGNAIAAIETEYAGHLFRSRLEARWAAFFDLLKWPWVYEPFDLPGWIPDFLLAGKVFVEVKPFTRLGDFEDVIQKVWRGIKASRWDLCELLLLGVGPFVGHSGCESACIGWIGENYGHFDSFDIKQSTDAQAHPWEFDEAAFIREGELVDICSSTGSWRGRIRNLENDSGGSFCVDRIESLQAIWGKAHRLTRWEPGRNRTTSPVGCNALRARG